MVVNAMLMKAKAYQHIPASIHQIVVVGAMCPSSSLKLTPLTAKAVKIIASKMEISVCRRVMSSMDKANNAVYI